MMAIMAQWFRPVNERHSFNIVSLSAHCKTNVSIHDTFLYGVWLITARFSVVGGGRGVEGCDTTGETSVTISTRWCNIGPVSHTP